jgi:ribosomal protein L37E
MVATPLVKCPRCGTLYPKARLAVCKACSFFEEQDYSKVRDSMLENGLGTSEEVAQTAGVEVGVVLRMIEVGMISLDRPDEQVPCGRCGKPAISKSKRLCQKCMMQLDVALGAEKRKVATEVDRAREATAREMLEAKRRDHHD